MTNLTLHLRCDLNSTPHFFVDNGRICMIYDHNLTNDTLGPFAVGEWSKFVFCLKYVSVCMETFMFLSFCQACLSLSTTTARSCPGS